MCLQIADRVGVSSLDVRNVIIWGNHSSTQFPDVRHAIVTKNGRDLAVPEAVSDDHWLKNEFITVTCSHVATLPNKNYNVSGS